MGVRATLVMGADGSTSFLGSSDGITSPEDRQQFLARRRQSDVIIIGGNTARYERYRWTPVPLIIISHTYPEMAGQNPKAQWWNLSPVEAIARASKEFGPSVFVEGGASMIQELLSVGAISHLDLSITPARGGENRVDSSSLLAHFKEITKTERNGTIFYSCMEPVTLQK
ncbi:MAG: dihydrofolate reductase family protein [Actinobacteria bacterium]|nr:dihydrofolate reductase family protein [Actinomycetota bacterium]